MYVVPNVVSQRDLVSRPDNMDETVLHTYFIQLYLQQYLHVSYESANQHLILNIPA